MRSLTVVLAICFASFVVCTLAESNLDEWNQYKSLHGKEYATKAEDMHRMALFLKTKAFVEQHNQRTDVSHKMGLNHFADWTDEEKDRSNGLLYEPRNGLNNTPEAEHFLIGILADNKPIPAELDWRKVPGRVSEVKDQGKCKSCWAFATTGVLEGQETSRKFRETLAPLSEQELVDCSPQNHGCEGGLMSSALDDLAVLGGIEGSKQYEYQGVDGKCRFDKSKVIMTDFGHLDLLENNEEHLKEVVAKSGPVAVGVFATDSWFNYDSGVLNDVNCPKDLNNHGVLIVGYGTSKEDGDYWIIKNSWGSSWGEKGYLRLKRGVNMCGVALIPTIPIFKP